MKVIRYCFSILVSVVMLCSCRESSLFHKNAEEENAADSLRSFCIDLTKERRFTELISSMEPYFDLSMENDYVKNRGEYELFLYANVYIAQAYLFLDNIAETERRLSFLEENSRMEKMPLYALLTYHNIRGILAMKKDMNYGMAMYHFHAALGVDHGEYNICPVLCNIANIYLERQDTSGIRYARRALDVSEKNGDGYSKMYSSLLMAKFLYIRRDSSGAIEYAMQTEELMKEFEDPLFSAYLQILLGDMAGSDGRYDEAEGYYRSVLENEEIAAYPICTIESLLKIGNTKISVGEYREALDYFRQGLSLSVETDIIENRAALLGGISESYGYLGDKDSYIRYFRAYHELSDSLSLLQKERDFHTHLMNIERMQYEERLYKNEIKLQRNRENTVVISFILLLFFLILSGVWIMYRKKNSMYKILYEQHQKYRQKMKATESMMESIEHKKEKSDEKLSVIYTDIEKIMKEEKLYRQENISVEKMAERMCTNRTYISSAINAMAGMTFTAYINAKRIEDATQILSDTNDNRSLKVMAEELGFNSMSAFSRVFLREIGCPPSTYRRLKREES